MIPTGGLLRGILVNLSSTIFLAIPVVLSNLLCHRYFRVKRKWLGFVLDFGCSGFRGFRVAERRVSVFRQTVEQIIAAILVQRSKHPKDLFNAVVRGFFTHQVLNPLMEGKEGLTNPFAKVFVRTGFRPTRAVPDDVLDPPHEVASNVSCLSFWVH